jgi:mono/diheme cytochrome c family protein
MSARKLASFALCALLCAPGSLAAQPDDGSFQSGERYLERNGEAVFKDICAACHMPDGSGATGAARYPALKANTKLAAAAYPVFMVVNGKGAMPSFARTLTDEQIAGVVNYVRTHFGNDYKDAVAPAEVKSARP